MKRKIRFGIIGCSRISDSSTIPAIIESQYAELEFIGSRTTAKAKRFAKKFDCKKYGTYEEVLKDNQVDAVYISVPIGLHEKWSIRAARAGKHILCEKSSTSSYESAKKMVSESKKNNVRIMEGFMFRFHPSILKISYLVNKKTIGKIFSFQSRYGFPSISKKDIRYQKKLGGGILNDAGCYPICASRILFNEEPKSIYCNLITDKKYKIDEFANILLIFKDGKVAEMNVGYGLFYQSIYEIWGSKGMISLSRAYNIPPNMSASLKINTEKIMEIKIKPENHFKLMIDSFSKEIQGQRKHSFNFERDLLNQARIMEAGRRSSQQKRMINISEII
ncbi:Gfo/Idh/MocA family protein [Candidatus Nitrosarchaeum limnium]|uniref:Oxidoreductase, NAD-binding domain protein n=1 Tax=Candidatus Nitrosarchaeum limnium BG20 TaxID=859192 RepID=S2EKY9_9ARCH|nr:Gfo/Idh/MocA family oxidoreductase [Candidatus Nitrosarchaeum limnium]EPA05302.1 oxidoreductase, NAD-binding domain protein [Candidatus Nitrosarchaeum limnium BG20]